MSRSMTTFRFTRLKTKVSVHLLIAVDETGQVSAYSVDRCEDVDRLILDIGEDLSGRVEVYHITRTLRIPSPSDAPGSIEKKRVKIDRSAPAGRIAVNMILAIDKEGNVAVDTIDDIQERVMFQANKKRNVTFYEAAEAMLKVIKFYDPVDLYLIREVVEIPSSIKIIEIVTEPFPERDLIFTTKEKT